MKLTVNDPEITFAIRDKTTTLAVHTHNKCDKARLWWQLRTWPHADSCTYKTSEPSCVPVSVGQGATWWQLSPWPHVVAYEERQCMRQAIVTVAIRRTPYPRCAYTLATKEVCGGSCASGHVRQAPNDTKSMQATDGDHRHTRRDHYHNYVQLPIGPRVMEVALAFVATRRLHVKNIQTSTELSTHNESV